MVKAVSGKDYPQSLDYFIAKGKYEKRFADVYNKASTIQIVFISDNYNDSCAEYYEFRDAAGRLLAQGDGAVWKKWDKTKEAYVEYNATLEQMETGYKMKAKTVLRMRFIIPKIPSVFGVWEFTTHGVDSSIPSIRDAFDTVQNLAGSVINIAFDLHVEKVESNKPGAKSVFPVVTLIANVCKENMELLASYYEQGKKLRGMIDDERINSLQLIEANITDEIPTERLFFNDEDIAEINTLAEVYGIGQLELMTLMEDSFGHGFDTFPYEYKQELIDNIKQQEKRSAL